MNSRQLSFLITLFSMGIVIGLLFIIKLKGEQAEDTYEVVLEQEVIEEEIAQAEAEAPGERIRSHRVFNEDLKEPIEDPEPIRTAEEILNEMKEDRPTEQQEEGDDYSKYLEELAEQRRRNARLLEEKNKKEEARDVPSYAKDRNTSAYFSLVGRRPLGDRLPLPVYTCIQGGRVVVNITVDADGYVTEARFNARASSTSNGCLVDNALEYASRARFDASNQSAQIGTITYLFQGK